jgi:hypothetical protein
MTCHGQPLLSRVMERSCLPVRTYISFAKILKGFPLNVVSSNLRNFGQRAFIQLRKYTCTTLIHYAMAHQITDGEASGFGEDL